MMTGPVLRSLERRPQSILGHQQEVCPEQTCSYMQRGASQLRVLRAGPPLLFPDQDSGELPPLVLARLFLSLASPVPWIALFNPLILC